jgi:hypothetical protein
VPLVGVVLLGGLAACAAEHGGEAQTRALLRAELNAFGIQQIRFHDQRGRYGRSAQELGIAPAAGIRIEVPHASDAGYVARAIDERAGVSCTLSVGEVPPAHADGSGIRCP